MEEQSQKPAPDSTCQSLARQLNWWRVLQMLLNLAIFILATYLAAYIGEYALGLAGGLPATCVISGLSFIVTFITWWLRHFRGYYRRGCVFAFILFDCLCVGLQIGTLSVLSASGLPWNCKGLTNTSFGAGDTPNNPLPGYSTVRFGDDSPNDRGMLDHYCPIPKACFWQSVALLLFYPWTIGLSIRLVVSLSHKRKADKELATKCIELEDNRQSVAQPIDISPPGPPQEMPDVLSQATELPSPVSVEMSSPVPMEIPSPLTSYMNNSPRPEGSYHLEATISNGSWGSSAPRNSLDPPPYQPDQKFLPNGASKD